MSTFIRGILKGHMYIEPELLDAEITNALSLIGDGNDIEREQLEVILSAVDHNLRSDETEIAWDDAWDVIRFICPRHVEGLDYLMHMSDDIGPNTQRDIYARIWAVRAIGRIGASSAPLVALLEKLSRDSDRGLQNEAKKTLKILLRR